MKYFLWVPLFLFSACAGGRAPLGGPGSANPAPAADSRPAREAKAAALGREIEAVDEKLEEQRARLTRTREHGSRATRIKLAESMQLEIERLSIVREDLVRQRREAQEHAEKLR